MLGSEVITMMKQRLNRSTSASTSFETWILDELKRAQDRLETDPELPSILLSERSFIDITISEERVVLPTDFLRENEEDDMQVFETVAADFTEITKSDMDEMRVKYPDEETGRPRVYTFMGKYFRLRPVPEKATYRLYMTYFQKDAVLTSGGAANEWSANYPDLLMSEAGIILATTLKNQGALTMFTGLRGTERIRLINNETAKQMANYQPTPED